VSDYLDDLEREMERDAEEERERAENPLLRDGDFEFEPTVVELKARLEKRKQQENEMITTRARWAEEKAEAAYEKGIKHGRSERDNFYLGTAFFALPAAVALCSRGWISVSVVVGVYLAVLLLALFSGRER
jgi:hypothetical protein